MREFGNAIDPGHWARNNADGEILRRNLAHESTRLLDVERTTTTELT